MPKNIVVCYDGTGNEYGRHNTNVVGIFGAIVRDQQQVAFYDPGVGTFSFLGRTLGKKVGVLLGKAFGLGLIENVEDGYLYLMNTYEEGDKVFIFGFSRGAFTARVLASMVHKVGVLQKGSNNLIPYATKMYFEKNNKDVANGFKATYGHECKTHFVGVWDTVASLGHFFGKKFSDNRLNPGVTHGRHAIAIDEKRKKFLVSLWDENGIPESQTIEQVWFAGVHSDIGGWYDERGLSDIAQIWMVKHAESAGLRLKDNWETTLHPDPEGELHVSRSGFWRLWPPAARDIPNGANIHDSVRQRIMKKPGYEPENLPRS